MRFMMIRRADKLTEAGGMPDPNILAAMEAYHDEMEKAGILRGGEGLKPSSEGFRIKFNGGTPTVVDGPFAETKELIAGYSIIEVPTKADAVAWAKKWPAILSEANVELELRPYFELSDFENWR
jgi:hypothetical protein